MKKNRKGEPVCEKGEVRLGNFFVKAESSGMVKISDLSGMMVHRVSVDLPVGAMLLSAVVGMLDGEDGPYEEFLHLYCSMMWLFSSVVPIVRKGDDGKVEYNFWEECFTMMSRAADEAKAVYGVKDAPSEEEDGEALEGVKDAVALEDELKELVKSEGISE